MSEDIQEQIRLANDRMTIVQACQYIGMPLGDFAVHSVKTYCPFGEMLHEDGGRSKAFRVYPGSNSAYCFACAAFYTPVKLIAVDRDIPEISAAELVLEEVGYVPPNLDARWQAAVYEKHSVDMDGMANALKLACGRMDPDWNVRQFDDDIAEILRKCLSLLYKVHTEDEARQWLSTTKTVMRNALSRPRKQQDVE